MAELTLTDGAVHIALTGPERAWTLRRSDFAIPTAALRSVRAVPDAAATSRVLRTPGVPAVRRVGTWRSGGRRSFVSIATHQPAVMLRMGIGSPFDTILIGSDRADDIADELLAALPPTRRDVPIVLDPAADALRGSLRLPGDGPQPAALLLPGSGPIDRDGDAPGSPLGIQLALAEALAGAGIASLRYDRRGIGDDLDWRSVGLHENTADAALALRSLAAHPEVDARRIIVIGHSEGALHALRLAVSAAPPAAAVLLSAPARPGSEVLAWQAEQLEPGLPKPVRAVLRVTRTDLAAKTRASHDKLRATSTDIARINGARVNAKWFREFLDDDPREDLARLAVPTLALTGTADLQTPPDDLAVIAELAPGPVDLQQPEGVTHLLRRDPAEVPTLQDYKRQLRQPVDEQVLRSVTAWAAGQLTRGGDAG